MVNNIQSLYNERLKRIEDAIALRVPDRVPVFTDFGYLAARYSNLTYEEICYDPDKWALAHKKIIIDFQPDMFQLITKAPYGVALEAIDTKMMKWPGHGVSSNRSHQFVEGEYMLADEYDAFLASPGDFTLRTYLPRVAGALAPLKKLPPLFSFTNIGRASGPLGMFAEPDFVSAFESIYKAAKDVARWETVSIAHVEEMDNLGFPSNYMALGMGAPFDYISDFYRGMRGTMIDMYRQPAKLLAAIEKLLPFIIEIVNSRKATPGKNNLIFIAPHRGADGFMSTKQFETFYWPGLKTVINAVINAGFTPYIFWEGDYTSRLEYLLELPRGKTLARFDKVDFVKAKRILGGHTCIAGGVMPSLIQNGTVREVKDYCNRLIDTVGRDGGYILTTSVVMDEANPENVKAMIDSVKEYTT